ncbi:hypothetical protein [Actinomadura oligospora]|uniref:hypothetical protein n=1 Tax=Actinomadura oligospora TaxID=111804 RepID=UPI00047B1042|nr:hypothetical protein [Actinomadura oligospora]
MSDSSERWARDQLPATIDGMPVRHVPWDTVRAAVRASRAATRGRERPWLDRVKRFEVVPRLGDRWPAITREESDGPHIVYGLGPDIPIPEISTKGTSPTGRVWCLLDQLLVHPPLTDAVRASKRLGT